MIIIVDNGRLYKIRSVGYIREIGDFYIIENENNEKIGIFIEYNEKLKGELEKNGKVVVLKEAYANELKKIAEILKKLYNGGDKE